MNKAIQALRRFLREVQWQCEVWGEQAIGGWVSGDVAQWRWHAEATGDDGFLVFRGICPVRAPAERRPAVAEYLARANCGLRWGNFELSWPEGEVSFKTSLSLEAGRSPRKAQLCQLVFGNHWAMNRYLAGLVAVAFGHRDPRKAVEQAEADLPEETSLDESPEAHPTSPSLLDRFRPGEN